MKEGVVVVVGGAVVVMVGRLGGLGAAFCWCTGSPSRRLRGPAFVKVFSACQQAVIGQAAITGRVVRRGRLISQAFEAGGGGGSLGDVMRR